MDYLDKDIREVKRQLTKEFNLAAISSGLMLDKVALLVSCSSYAVVLQHVDSIEPFFVSQRFFSWLASRTAVDTYTASDFRREITRQNNAANLTSFFSHFTNPQAIDFRCWWKFVNAKKEIIDLCSISCLLKPDKEKAFVLSLFYYNNVNYPSGKIIVDDLWRGIDKPWVLQVAATLTEREWEVFEYDAYGISETVASQKVFLSEHTYHDYRKSMRKKFDNLPQAVLARFYFAIKYSGKMTG